jgi:hypothetical protein
MLENICPPRSLITKIVSGKSEEKICWFENNFKTSVCL